jgi:hypothetical protein
MRITDVEGASRKRVVAGVAATLLLSALAMALIQPACGCSSFSYVGVSDLVRAYPGLSVGLVTVTAGGGEVRTNPATGGTETSIRVAPISWVGTVATMLWVTDDTLSSSGLSLAAFRPGTQWVVRVQNADAAMSHHPLLVVGDTVRIPWEHLAADPEGPKPEVVNLDELRGMARRQQS